MIVFDVDGTLIGGEKIDWLSFDSAFEEVAGFVLDENFFASIQEITAQAIVHQALRDLTAEERTFKEHAVRRGYLDRLKAAHKNDPRAFAANDGAQDLLQEAKKEGIDIAIATGDWRETILFKLSAAGIAFDGIPIVTSSEYYSRSEIIRAAVEKAGRSLKEAIYVGDGLWDLRACRQLGIPFIGVGRRREELGRAGAAHVLPDLSPQEFWRVRTAVLKAKN